MTQEQLPLLPETRHLFARPDRVLKHRHEDSRYADLWVLTSIFNPIRFRSRWKLYEDWIKRVQESGAKSAVVEIAFGDREHVLKDLKYQPDVLVELVTRDELWLKENALNVLTHHIPTNAQYVFFCDADFRQIRDDWANEIVQLLQHYEVIQTWTEMVDLDQNYEECGRVRSFMSNWKAGTITKGGDYYAPAGKRGYPGAPGLGNAWRREALDAVGGLIDWAIVGACDSYMAWGLIGNLDWALRKDFDKGYTEPMREWQRRAQVHIRKNIGCMQGMAAHFFHGPKAARGYATRERILAKTQFNPAVHLKKDSQGLYQLERSAPNYEELRDLLRGYFRQRQEDLYG